VTRLLAAVATLLLALTACTAPPPGDAADAGATTRTSVRVDTPQLRELKQDAGIAPCPSSDAEPAEDGLPDVVLPCLGGGSDVNLARLRGPMVVNFWAQWCGPCREELPYYQQLHEAAAGKVQVVGVDWLDTQPTAALELARSSGVTYPLVADPAAATKVPLRIRGLPGVAFVDADGRLVDVQFLVIESYAQLRALVADKLGVHVPAAG
jgi:thiol-disulfide isomerase/thioredoxin